jgi:LysM repeat protein
MKTGENAMVDIHVTCPLDLCATIDITIQFDPDVIQIQRIDTATSLFEPVLSADNRIDNESGVIRLIASAVDPSEQPTPGPDGEVERVFELYVSAVNPGTSPLRVDNLYVFDEAGDALRATSIDGGIFVETGNATSVQETCTYRVQSGDTLSGIAAANNVSVAQITALNEIPNQSVIRVGTDLTIPASNCHAPAQVRSTNNGSSKIFDVYDCRNLGSNVFEWYQAQVDYDTAGNPSSVTHLGGPYSGAWQPGCPAPTTSDNSSSNNNHSDASSSTGSSGGSSGSGDNSGDSGDSGSSGGGLGGIVCGVLGC